MSNSDKIKYFFNRDGTNQKQRSLEALSKNYIDIDERGLKEILEYTYEYSKIIGYFNINNHKISDWTDFFDDVALYKNKTEWKKYLKQVFKSPKPHFALYITFLRLFKYAQDQLNQITWRHLDYYYSDILQLTKRKATPDKAHIIFTPAKNVKPFIVKKDSEFIAGKDATGKTLYYKLVKEATINEATLSEIKSSFNDKEEKNIYIALQANSADGNGEAFDIPEPKWHAFGKKQKILDNGSNNYKYIDQQTMALAQIGFAVESPVLELKEGNRVIEFIITYIAETESLTSLRAVKGNSATLVDIFKVSFSGEKGWIGPYGANCNISFTKKTISLKIVIEPDELPIVNYSEKILNGSLNAGYPVAKILLNSGNSGFNYLDGIQISSISISVDVDNLQNLIIQNNYSLLDKNKPFQPFGPEPILGNEFYIGSNEIFKKSLTSLDIRIQWQDPPSSFNTHYKDYKSSSGITNSKFTFEMQLLDKNKWNIIKTNNSLLFDNNGTQNEKLISAQFNSNHEIILSDGNKTLNYTGKQQDKTFSAFDKSLPFGFLKMKLTGPATPISAFGHKEFRSIYPQKLIDKANKTLTGEIPNEPYTPLISSLKVDYKAEEKIDFTNTSGSKNFNSFHHLGLFGNEKKDVSQPANPTLLVVHEDEGAMYLGFKGLDPPQNLSVFFQVAEGSGDATLDYRPPVKWSYLINNKWIDFTKNEVLEDSTKEFLTSGIITFSLPRAFNKNNSVLNKDLHWIKASVDKNSLAINNLIDIIPQAALVEFTDKGNDPAHLFSPLPQNSISKPVIKDPNVKKIEQPFASYGGKVLEQDEEFYVRVSERLRHKNRAISVWDYEHLVLEEFPSVYKVKCLNHTDREGAFKPGCVTLVVVSNLYNKNAIDPLRPAASENELNNIKIWLEGSNGSQRLIPPFVELSVRNPDFEEIEVGFKVEFQHGLDFGIYSKSLNEDIIKFLSPWAFKEGEDISFDGKIHKSRIINFIEELDYVDYLIDFEMNQVTKDKNRLLKIDIAETTGHGSILVSAGSHLSRIMNV